MPEQTLFRSVHLEEFKPGGEIRVDIPRVQDIHTIMVTVEGNLTITVGAATSINEDAPAQLIKRASFNANGKTVLHNSSGVMAMVGNYERKFINTSVKPGTAVATHPVKLVLLLDRINFDGPRPKDSSFQAYLTSLLQLRLSLGDIDDVLVKGGATTAFTGNVEVFVDSSEEVLGSDGKSDKGESKFIRVITEQSETFNAANSRLELEMPVGNNIRDVVLYCTDDGVPNDMLVNNVEFSIDDTDVRSSSSWSALRYKNMGDKELSAMPKGVAVIDSNMKGKLSNCFDVTQATKCRIKADVSAPAGQGELTAMVIEYIFPE
ncbi:MAG: hypothetical protein OEY09_10410 [Gammaproteobacteria bacterium]|nr:hypothetical protein [Gammaproteobacteria bacterium]